MTRNKSEVSVIDERTKARAASARRALGRRCFFALLVGCLTTGACKHRSSKPKAVTMKFEAKSTTNEGRPFAVVVQESSSYPAGPPSYDEVAKAAGAGKPFLAKGTIYPGHTTELKLVGLAAGAQVIVSTLFTDPPEKWQRVMNLGSREHVTVVVGMHGIE